MLIDIWNVVTWDLQNIAGGLAINKELQQDSDPNNLENYEYAKTILWITIIDH